LNELSNTSFEENLQVKPNERFSKMNGKMKMWFIVHLYFIVLLLQNFKKCLKLPLGSSFFLYYLKGRKDKANFWEDLTQRLTSKLQDEEYESFCSFVNVY
jgi:hypothetical protein